MMIIITTTKWQIPALPGSREAGGCYGDYRQRAPTRAAPSWKIGEEVL